LTSGFLGNLLRTIIIPINEAELRKNTAQGVKAATIKPPTMGPTTRPMLLAMALRVRALGSSDLDTSPLIVGIMGVLIIVVPAPSAKVSISNTVVVVRPTRVRIPSAVDIVNMYAHVIRSILRRSKISDNIPDGNANRKIGRVVAVVIRETNKGFGASEVISHDAPTSYIAAPTYEKRAAIHNVLYRLDLKGLKPDAEISSSLSSCLSLPIIRISKQGLVIHFSILELSEAIVISNPSF
jgi:hypothetical protein